MTWVDITFFVYSFIGLYMTSIYLFIYFPNRKRLFESPPGKIEPVSIVMPCYNEEETIGKAIEALLRLDWPKNMLEIIVVDDLSKDNSAKIIKKYAAKYKNVRLIINSHNSGGAAEPTNIGIKNAKYNYIAVADADSMPSPDALKKMIGFLQNDFLNGGVTCAVLAREPKTFMQKLQAIEYRSICFNRKLLDIVDAVYVTPGPFALYKKKVLEEIGYFDKKNMTQDIEIVWRMRAQGYKARMCMATHVYSETPKRFKDWWRQRIRWNIGGTQCLSKYKHLLFKKGMLGAFIIPYFSLSLFIGLFGLGMYLYLMGRKLLVSYLSTKYSLYASTAIFRLEELSFTPSVLNFFGIVLFILGLGFTLFALGVVKKQHPDEKHNLFNIFFYMIVYLAIYPIVMATALSKFITGKYSW